MNPDRVPAFSRTAWTAAEVAAVMTRSLAPGADRSDPLRCALEAVLAHYCQILVAGLNRVPDAHLAAFVSLLRASPVPPVPATVPLAFKAARAPAVRAAPVVPRRTEVAAAASGGGAPVVFQTTRDLQVLRAELTRAMAVDGRRQVVADAAAILQDSRAACAGLFASAMPITQAMHIGDRRFGEPSCLAGVQLTVEIDDRFACPKGPAIEWGIASPGGFVPLAPLRDTTQGLTRSGELAFGACSAWQLTVLRGIECCWLTARLRAAPATDAALASASCATIRRLRVSTQHASAAVPPQAALFGRVPLDVTREFFPFGERPRFGDVFYLASQHFALAGARIELQIVLCNPADADPDATPIAPVSRAGSPRTQWDIHTAAGWVPLAVIDGTDACTLSGTLAFSVPMDAAPATLGNVTAGWIRARFVSGSYSAGVAVSPAAPAMASVAIAVSIARGPDEPERLIVDNGLEQREVRKTTDSQQRAPFSPFHALDVRGQALCLGVQAARDELAGHSLSFYVGVNAGDAPPVLREVAPDTPPARWQVRGATGWVDCSAIDRTGGLRESGYVTVSVGDDVAPWSDAVADPDGKLWWLRLLLDPDGTRATAMPDIGRIVLNAVPGVQTARYERELLGSSTDRPAQRFHAARSPFIGNVELEVREGPAADGAAWVRWQCVADFDGSAPDSPHFVVDRLNGAVVFGDGRRGRIPPAGGNNIRISYASGGGALGNCAAQTVKQLRTTIPYVESVTNVDAASGGQDAQDAHAVRGAALAWLRHRDRAVCIDDYAALALRASPDVARAAAVGAGELNLGTPAGPPPNVVGISIVPRSDAARPQPSAALLRNVGQYLAACRPAGVELVLFGPSYLCVSVSAALAISPDAHPVRVIAQCEALLDRFLHPLAGGPDGRGWAFGERPHASDCYRVLDGVDGLDHVQSLRLHFDEAWADAPGAARLLVAAGCHRLRAG